MNFGTNFIDQIFGKALGLQISGTAISTDGLQRFSTKSLLGELGRRFEKWESPETDGIPEPKLDQWLCIEDVTEKYFKGIKPHVVAKFLFLIGHPYRLQRQNTDERLGVEKIFLEDTMKIVADAFERNSRQLACNGSAGLFFHPIVGRYERVGCSCNGNDD